jgi:hypothetical protein
VGLFTVPNSVKAITPLVGQILVESETRRSQGEVTELLPLLQPPHVRGGLCARQSATAAAGRKWRRKLAELPWPTKNLPEVMGGGTATLRALIREYLFVSLFRACAESLASENASRLAAMQRADKNIDELLEDLNGTFHRLRQSGIDEELFDVISGFEALSVEGFTTPPKEMNDEASADIGVCARRCACDHRRSTEYSVGRDEDLACDSIDAASGPAICHAASRLRAGPGRCQLARPGGWQQDRFVSRYGKPPPAAPLPAR